MNRDLLLQKAIDKLLRCLTYGIREEFDFPSLCNCGRNGTRATSNRVGPLSPADHHQSPDFRGQKYESFSFISRQFILGGVEISKISTTVWFSQKGARGTIVKCPERQLLFDSPNSTPEYVVWFFHLCYNFVLTSVSLSERPFLYDIVWAAL